jgi:hypothetical protein
MSGEEILYFIDLSEFRSKITFIKLYRSSYHFESLPQLLITDYSLLIHFKDYILV